MKEKTKKKIINKNYSDFPNPKKMAYLQIYKNKPNAIYNYSVLKGDNLYEVNIVPGEKMRWRYVAKIDSKVFQINGTLIHKPSMKMIVILQRTLQPPTVNESLIEGSVFRLASQDWLKEFIDNHGFISHGDRFISFSFDSESGGQDAFGGAEIKIELNKESILRQGEEQGLGPIEYDEFWMKQHPKICLSVTGHRSKTSYYQTITVKNDKEAWESQEMTWESYLESFEAEQEIVLHKLKDEIGLIKNVTFNAPADAGLVNKLNRKNIPYQLKQEIKDDPQYHIPFESKFIAFKDWKSINEGGNAIPESRSVTWEEARETVEWVKKEIIPFLNLNDEDIDLIGSYGKKKEGDLHGDIDVAVSADAIMDKNAISEDEMVSFIQNALKEKGLQTKINTGFRIISFGAPISGDIDKGLCQVDLMITPSLDWSRFIYHSPDFKKNESKYKGKIRNIFLMAILTETQKNILKRTPEGGVEELEVNVLRYPKGIWRTRKNFMGKKGLVKTGKNLTQYDQFVTSNPQEATELAVGEGYNPSDINTFEKLWTIVTSPGFKWIDKLDEILIRYNECLHEQGLMVPEEAKEQYPEIFA